MFAAYWVDCSRAAKALLEADKSAERLRETRKAVCRVPFALKNDVIYGQIVVYDPPLQNVSHFSGISPRGLNRKTSSRISPIVSRRICAALSIRWAFNALPSDMPEVTS